MIMLRGMFGILMTLLNAKRPVTRKELAEKFEICERTVSRYIDAMSADCGIPVTAEYGIGGGYMLADNYRLGRMYFTVDEYDRILTCISALENELSDEVTTSLKDKFTHLRENADGEKFLVKNERFVIDSTSWQNPDLCRYTISALGRAIDGGKSVRISYVDKRDSRTERVFDPYTLVLKEGVWYAYGWCHVREDFRLFKLSRIKALNVLEESFEKRPGDVYKKLAEEFIDREKTDIEIELDSDALASVEEWLGVDSVTTTETEGVYRAKGYVYSEDLLIKKLLAFGSHVKVLSPDFVAEELAAELTRAAALYKKA